MFNLVWFGFWFLCGMVSGCGGWVGGPIGEEKSRVRMGVRKKWGEMSLEERRERERERI